MLYLFSFFQNDLSNPQKEKKKVRFFVRDLVGKKAPDL